MASDSAIVTSRAWICLDRVKRSAFVRNVLVVMTGTAIAQAVGFSLSPIISRLYTPEDFGVFGSFGSVAAILAAGSTLEYSQAIMLPKQVEDAFHLFLLSVLTAAAIALVCLTSGLLAPFWVAGLIKGGGKLMVVLLTLSVLAAGLNAAFQAWCVRVKAFRRTSASQVVRSVSCNGMQLALGSVKGGATGLIVSDVVADVLASVSLLRVLHGDFQQFRQCLRWDRMRKLAVEYHDFPLYSASQSVINALSSGLPVLLLTHYYGLAVAGAYAFGARILHVPMGFVLRALRQVLFQKAGETLHHGRSLAPLYVKVTVGLLGISVVPTIVLVVWSPMLFVWLFGGNWLLAGEFARSLAVWLMFAFCNLPAVLFARLIRVQRRVFLFDLVVLAIRTLTLVMGGHFLTAAQTVFAFSIVGAVMNGVLILMVGHAVMRNAAMLSWGQLRSSLNLD